MGRRKRMAQNFGTVSMGMAKSSCQRQKRQRDWAVSAVASVCHSGTCTRHHGDDIPVCLQSIAASAGTATEGPVLPAGAGGAGHTAFIRLQPFIPAARTRAGASSGAPAHIGHDRDGPERPFHVRAGLAFPGLEPSWHGLVRDTSRMLSMGLLQLPALPQGDFS